MFQINKNFQIIAGIVLLCVLAAMVYWGYQELLTSYQNFEFSNMVLSTILEQQSQRLWDYEYTTKIISDRLDQAQTLIEQYRRENGKLREKIELLGAMDALQETIARLKDENALVLKELEAVKMAQSVIPQKDKIFSRKEGRELIAKHHQKIKEIQGQIHDIKRQMQELKIAEQKELDRIESQLGNNGYLIRNGKSCSSGPALSPETTTINIDVKFLP